MKLNISYEALRNWLDLAGEVGESVAWKDRASPVAPLSRDLRSSLLQKWGDKLFH